MNEILGCKDKYNSELGDDSLDIGIKVSDFDETTDFLQGSTSSDHLQFEEMEQCIDIDVLVSHNNETENSGEGEYLLRENPKKKMKFDNQKMMENLQEDNKRTIDILDNFLKIELTREKREEKEDERNEKV